MRNPGSASAGIRKLAASCVQAIVNAGIHDTCTALLRDDGQHAVRRSLRRGGFRKLLQDAAPKYRNPHRNRTGYARNTITDDRPSRNSRNNRGMCFVLVHAGAIIERGQQGGDRHLVGGRSRQGRRLKAPIFRVRPRPVAVPDRRHALSACSLPCKTPCNQTQTRKRRDCARRHRGCTGFRPHTPRDKYPDKPTVSTLDRIVIALQGGAMAHGLR